MPRWTEGAREARVLGARRGEVRSGGAPSYFRLENYTQSQHRSHYSRWLHCFSPPLSLHATLSSAYLLISRHTHSPTSIKPRPHPTVLRPFSQMLRIPPVQSQLTPHTRSSCCFTFSRIRCATESRIGSPTRERRSRIWRRGCTVVTACHGGSACGRCRPCLCARFDRLRLPPGRGSQVPDHGSKRLRFLGSAHPVSSDGEEDAKNEYKRKDTATTHSALGHHVATVLVCRCVRPWT